MIETLSTVWSIFIIVVGVGMLIFIHELGHFIMAKKHKVRVDSFSLGMGPVIYKWKKGETEYRISLIPLGGYVNMPGELPDKDKPMEEFELRAKKPWQRFQIFVAGALMNLIIALPICTLSFLAGKKEHKPIVAIPGTAEAQAGMLPGDEIISIDGRPVEYMQEYTMTILGKMKDQTSVVKVKRGNDIKELNVKQMGSKFHGVIRCDNVVAKVIPDSPAAKGQTTKTITTIKDGKTQHDAITVEDGIKENDEIISVEGQPIFHSSKLIEIIKENSVKKLDKRLIFTVYRIEKDGPALKYISVQIPTKKVYEIPVDLSLIEPIVREAIDGAPAGSILKPDDRIEQVNGNPVNSISDLMEELKNAGSNAVKLKVKRGEKYENFTLFTAFTSTGNRALGISYTPSSNIIADVKTQFYKDTGLQKGDKIIAVGNKFGSLNVQSLFGTYETDDPIDIEIERNGKKLKISVTPQRTEYGDFSAVGITAMTSNKIFKRWDILSAVKGGVTETISMIELTFGALYKLVAGHESVKDLAGPVGVGHISYEFTKIGIGNFLWLLALFTVNLGILNLLPIPVLDGGHVFLLLIEKIRGKPPGEKFIMVYQLTGFCFLVLLLVFATYNDIGRLVVGRFK